jgi:tetratricopeptide (TPR) repeat protein
MPLQVKPLAREQEVIRLRPGELPEVTLTSGMLYRILAAEISYQRGQYVAAGSTMLELARETGDRRLAKRAIEFYLAGGSLPGALEAARAWVRVSPDDPEAVSTELALAAAAGQTSGLATALRKRIDEAQDKSSAIGQSVAVLSRMPDKRAALDILDRAVNESKGRNLLAAHLALSDMAQAAGDAPRALAEARLGLAVSPRSEEAAMRVFEYGMAVDPEKALKDARSFVTAHPASRRLRLLIAGQLAERGDYDASLAELQSMARRSPEDFDLIFMQAQVAYRAKRLDQARALLDQFVSIQTQRQTAAAAGSTDAPAALADAYLLLARIAEDQGRLDDAIVQLGKIEEHATRYTSRMRQAALRARQGKVDEALAIIDAANPGDDEELALGVLTSAQILRDAGRPADAIRRLKAAEAELPESVEIKYELAMLYERENKLAEAEKLLREVIAIDPGHAHSYNALGYALADRNVRLPEALELITRAMEIAPEDPFIMDSMGWIKFRMGDLNAAQDFLTRAYRKRPEADIAAHLGEVLWMLGQKDEARAIWKEGAARDPNNATLLETTRRFGVKL